MILHSNGDLGKQMRGVKWFRVVKLKMTCLSGSNALASVCGKENRATNGDHGYNHK